MHTILLRPANPQDLAAIQYWPAYPEEFRELDYALRSNGWIAEFAGKPGASIYVAVQGMQLVAFSVLDKTGNTEAEFRIALHPSLIGKGIGKTVTLLTLQEGFAALNLSRIHLIARTGNIRAIRLYQSLGFKACGTCRKTIHDKPVEFVAMDIIEDCICS